MQDLKTTLIDVYETLRYQQELLAQTAVRTQAATTVLMHFEQLAELYPKELEKIENGKIAEQAALILAAINRKLQALKAEPESQGSVQ